MSIFVFLKQLNFLDCRPQELENAWKDSSTEIGDLKAQANELVASVDDPKISYSKVTFVIVLYTNILNYRI